MAIIEQTIEWLIEAYKPKPRSLILSFFLGLAHFLSQQQGYITVPFEWFLLSIPSVNSWSDWKEINRGSIGPLATNNLFGGAKWQLRIINECVGGWSRANKSNHLFSCEWPLMLILAKVNNLEFNSGNRWSLFSLSSRSSHPLLETFSAENQKVFGQTLFLLSSTHRDHLETLSQMIPLWREVGSRDENSTF